MDQAGNGAKVELGEKPLLNIIIIPKPLIIR